MWLNASVIIIKPIKVNYTDLQSQFQSSYYPFFGSCCWEMETFWVNLCYEMGEHSVQTTDDSRNVISQEL